MDSSQNIIYMSLGFVCTVSASLVLVYRPVCRCESICWECGDTNAEGD